MSTSSIAYESEQNAGLSRFSDYCQLIRPKIAVLELVTLAVGAIVASSGIPAEPWILLHAMIGTTLLAASASIINQWLERDTDKLMERTASRPLPAGRMTGTYVLSLGSVTGIVGTIYLTAVVNLPTALLGFACWFLYVAIYTPMKFRTPANTMVGAISGGIPVLMGWTAVSGSFANAEGIMAASLFLIVFLWQFPHFMAIAWLYRDDYRAAGIKVIPSVETDGRRTAAQAIIAALCLLPVSLLPAMIVWNVPYFAGTLVLGVIQVLAAMQFGWDRNDKHARRLLRTTLVYLPALFGLLLVVPLIFAGN